jgi:uncharacterized membrane protein
MNASQIHLALTHVPVVLSFIGLVILCIGMLKKNETITKTSFYLLLAAGIFTVPVYLTGEGTEEAIENLPGVSESIISKHEDVAYLTLIVISLTALMALSGILFYSRRIIGKMARISVFILSLISAGAMAQTAHLGGSIRHTEIRSGVAAVSDQNTENGSNQNEARGTDTKDED